MRKVTEIAGTALLFAGCVLALMAALLLPLLSYGCAHRVSLEEPPTLRRTTVCFRALAEFQTADLVVAACFETDPMCEYARENAVRWAGVMKLKAVGQCNLIGGAK